MQFIPKDSKVCAHAILLPHLAFREKIYTFPHIRDAEYIALIPSSKNTWPYKAEGFKDQILKLKSDSTFTIAIDHTDFLLFKRQ